MGTQFRMGSHDMQQSGRVIRENPPRNLGIYSRLVILFGGILQQMGWGFFGFGMIFFWIFVMNSEARYLLSFDGKWVETQGVLKNVAVTNTEVNDRKIYAYTFSFTGKGGVHEAVCYDYLRREYERPNITVPVEYKEGNPKRARIKGMSTSTFPSFVLFVVIFPLLGLGFIIAGIIANLKSLKLLVNGHFTKGKIVNREATGTRINNNTVFKFTFEFETPGGMKHQTTCATHQTWKVEDEEMEIILYDPTYPENAVVFDAIPSAPQIDPQGHLEPAAISAASVFILPIISIALNVILFYIFVILGVSF
jgi:hypothetical protein